LGVLARVAVDVLGRLIDQRTIDTDAWLDQKCRGILRDEFE
jgi:hypothetical protein